MVAAPPQTRSSRDDAPARAIMVLHGPNLDLLGDREPEIYGRTTLHALDAELHALGERLGVRVESHQSNAEGELIEHLHRARSGFVGVIVNPGGYTHTSVAIHDALRAVPVPIVEVHLSNLYAREGFRQQSLTGAACRGVIMGLGPASYALALRHLAALAGSPAANDFPASDADRQLEQA